MAARRPAREAEDDDDGGIDARAGVGATIDDAVVVVAAVVVVLATSSPTAPTATPPRKGSVSEAAAASAAASPVIAAAASPAPAPRKASAMHCQRNLLETGSRPELGSSRSVNLESVNREMAKHNLRFVPPEMAPIFFDACSVIWSLERSCE